MAGDLSLPKLHAAAAAERLLAQLALLRTQAVGLLLFTLSVTFVPMGDCNNRFIVLPGTSYPYLEPD